MIFPPGRPLLVLTVAAMLAGGGLFLLARQLDPRPHLVLWTFDAAHAATYRDTDGSNGSLLDHYWRQTGRQVQVSLIQSRALDSRLLSLFSAGRTGRELPDLVEIEIGSLGKYLRGGADSSPLLPLEDFLNQSPLATRLVASRLRSYTVAGHVLGIPYDLHPVSLTYRKDLFDQAGVDLAECRTWNEFHAACLRFRRYWTDNGMPQRHAMELSRHSASELMMMLLQQRLDLFDTNGQLQLDSADVARTVAAYAAMVAGPRAIAGPAAAGGNLWVRDIADGRVCAALTPDWRIRPLRQLAPQLSGKLAMMPLPRFSAADAPTSTWGGTMLAIPRHAANLQLSWELLEFVLASPQALAARRLHSDLLPPLRTAPLNLDAPDPFFSNQPVGRLFYELGQEVPPRVIHPYTPLATQALARVLEQAAARVESEGDAQLDTWCHQQLAQAQQSLEKLIEFDQRRLEAR